jgi:hypothetical protein
MEWSEYAKSDRRPDNIPADPRGIYKDEGWAGMGDWLGTGTVANHRRQFRSFEQAREFARDQRLTSKEAWSEFASSGERPEDIPADPRGVYKDQGWVGYGDWLGTGTVAPRDRQYRRFKQAREFVHALGLKSQMEWSEYAKSDRRPDNIPADPRGVYKDEGWAGMGDWLGTGTVAPRDRQYRPFEEARDFARGLDLSSQKGWREFARSGRRPDNIPANPDRVYKDQGWVGYSDWLGRSRPPAAPRPAASPDASTQLGPLDLAQFAQPGQPPSHQH